MDGIASALTMLLEAWIVKKSEVLSTPLIFVTAKMVNFATTALAVFAVISGAAAQGTCTGNPTTLYCGWQLIDFDGETNKSHPFLRTCLGLYCWRLED